MVEEHKTPGPAKAVGSKQSRVQKNAWTKRKEELEAMKVAIAEKEKENKDLIEQLKSTIAAKKAEIAQAKDTEEKKWEPSKASIDVKPIEETPEKKTKTYHKVKVTNLFEPGIAMSFSYEGKYYDIPDGVECDLSKEVVDHLNSVVLRYTKKVENVNGKLIKEYGYRNRVMCQILDTFEKEV